ncbi:MAG: conserved rane protein of unknown function, partial [Blastococcus sp.]|nr:conserved rane protein of unknown function [Blastococcus sp.]
MLRRAADLTARARARIRAAREHDPHAWDHGHHDRRDHDRRDHDHREPYLHDDEPIDFVVVPDDHQPGDGGASGDVTAPQRDGAPPLGSPEPGAPDLDGA